MMGLERERGLTEREREQNPRPLRGGASFWTVRMDPSVWDRRPPSVARLLLNFWVGRYVVDAIREVGAEST